MAVSALEQELEVLPELGTAHESYETEWEGETESEQFFGALANLAKRGLGSLTKSGSPQRRFALWAAKKALTQGLPAIGRLAGAKLGGSANGAAGAALGRQAGSMLSGLLPQNEAETEWEGEAELNPVRKWYPHAMLEHLGHAAAETENEAEAEALAGAMIPLVARAVPSAAPAIIRATPGLVCGIAGVTRALRKGPGTKPLVRVVPSIARGAATAIARQNASGNQVTPQAAVQALASETIRVLGNQRQAAQAFKRSQQLDRQYHKASAGRGPTCGCGGRCQSCGAKTR
jgi:hypothetical protein